MRLSDGGKKIRAFAMVLTVGAIGLAGCSSTPPQPYNQYLASWKGKSEQELVIAFGIPENTHVMAQGGRVLEYTRKDSGDLVCTTRFTISSGGRVDGWWYKGKDCSAPPAV